MKGRMCSRAFAAQLYRCVAHVTETRWDRILCCSVFITMAFTSECKTDDLCIAAAKAGRAPSSALCRLQDGRSPAGPGVGVLGQMVVMGQGLHCESTSSTGLYLSARHGPPKIHWRTFKYIAL
ncbi:hypothetical protein ROHU_006617 [Labeo rohita]|uniref:Uncharacterized protein n=1 Tax=Labeo rohita TaxID=84645 RepID=A0A498MX84_LABRO|nr:hypothetical protein ROHU_006617 [Labeo rohita]